ncbi:hypothetical protein G6F43_005262 [Rhizopus delemar]|nr:hypothetical protein G6F43_005262 [Rhizopus delemar]
MIILKEQHPNVHACVPLNDGPRHYLEVYITPQNNNNDVFNQGLIFKEANLGAYSRSSLDDTANLKPNHSPLLPKKEVISGLQRSLAVFEYDVSTLLKLRYSTDPNVDTFFQWEGSVFCFIPNEPPKKLFNCVGMNVSRAKIEEGKLWTQSRELTYYLDPVTNEKLNKWDNPWTVVHIANDPIQMALPIQIPLDVRHNTFGGTSSIVTEIPLFYPNPLSHEKFSEFDSSKMYQAGEFFTFKCNTNQLESEETINDVDVNWTRVSRFSPFMKMKDNQGYLIFHCTGHKLPQGSTVNDLHPLLASEINKDKKAYATAPAEYDANAKSVSSWTYFRDNFDRYQQGEAI